MIDFCPYCDGDGFYTEQHVELDESSHVLCTWFVQVECEVCKGHGLTLQL